MLNIVSKQIEALKGTPRIDEYPIEQVREKMRGPNAISPDESKYDSGKPRQTMMTDWLSGFGANDRQHNPGAGMGLGRDNEQHTPGGVGSGYNDGEQAQDETGPGQSSSGGNEYAAVDLNELFLEIDSKSSDRKAIEEHLRRVQQSAPIENRRHMRAPVDRH